MNEGETEQLQGAKEVNYRHDCEKVGVQVAADASDLVIWTDRLRKMMLPSVGTSN